jgi:hypothetical protein
MSDTENRVWTPSYGEEITNAKCHDLQDNYCQVWTADRTEWLHDSSLDYDLLALGGVTVYGQISLPNATTTVLDNGYDWRHRMLDVMVLLVDAANKLPGGAAYTPTVHSNAAYTRFFTGMGATGTPDYRWAPIASTLLYADTSNNGRLLFSNSTGAALWGFFAISLSIQSPGGTP